MGAGLLAVKSGFILFIKNYQFPLQINTLERERAKDKRYTVVDTSEEHSYDSNESEV
jgi:hypothetical protein